MFIALVITCKIQYAVDITHLVNFDIALAFIFISRNVMITHNLALNYLRLVPTIERMKIKFYVPIK